MRLRFLRSPILAVALVAGIVGAYTPTAVRAVDSVIDGHIVFTGPGQGGSKDIHTNSTDGGLRIYNGSSLSAVPDGAAIQFYGNTSNSFPGQAFIDSGANNNAALIFRTAPTSGAISERLRITSDGSVGIGTSNPHSRLHVVGDYIQIPSLPVAPASTECDDAADIGRMVFQTSVVAPPPLLWLCNQVDATTFSWFALGQISCVPAPPSGIATKPNVLGAPC